MSSAKAPSFNDIRQRAAIFAAEWAGATSEHAESQTFWNEFFAIFGINRRRFVIFQANAVRVSTGKPGFIDVFWPGVLLAEHKSLDKSLNRAEDQALDYAGSIDQADLPRVIISTDFANIRILDLDEGGLPFTFRTKDLVKEVGRFNFIAGYRKTRFEVEDEANIQAARLMGALYEHLSKDGYEGHEASMLLTRLLFLLFGDDTAMWQRGLFGEFVTDRTSQDGADLGPQLSLLFQELDRPETTRSQVLDDYIKRFPYINGGLFKERLNIPTFDRGMRDQLLECCSFDWGRISPAVFGSLFQTIKSKEARRELGEHYTPEKYILRLIGPLFLDDLRTRIEAARNNAKQLKRIREQLRKQNYLDPACGCGNFLIVAYRELRHLELQILQHLERLIPNEKPLSMDPTYGLAVTIDQFHGIEIEEWPARIAETAMFIVDHQANQELAEVFGVLPDRLPLTKSANIELGNALQTDWATVSPINDNTYIFGNPPFGGTSLITAEQKDDLNNIWDGIKGGGNMDYVSCWHLIAARHMANCGAKTAFVSTNSITHGQQPPILWGTLDGLEIELDFAHQTFAWASDAPGKAAVHCVILGFSQKADRKNKTIYRYATVKSEPSAITAKNINAYLLDAPNVLVTSSQDAISPGAQKMFKGSQPTDNGYLSNINTEEASTIRATDPIAAKYLRPLIGAQELINGEERWCLWLKDATPQELRTSQELVKRLQAVRDFRLASTKKKTRDDAAIPQLFQEDRQPTNNYLAVPRVSSETRKYVPMALVSPQTIANDALLTVNNANLYTFGMLHSSVFMVWNATVSGRLESRFRISAEITYNNFPWPDNPANHLAIEEAAQAVIDARKNHPNANLADLYDPLAMPKDLVDAHRTLDQQVLAAYGLNSQATETEILAELFARYSALTAKEHFDFQSMTPKRSIPRKKPA